MTPLDLPAVSGLANEVLDEVERAVVGKREALTLVLSALRRRRRSPTP
jgi:MoxR-like ATPase